MLLAFSFFGIELGTNSPQLLASLFLEDVGAVQFALNSVVFFEEGQIVGHCLLIVLEEYVVLDLKVLGLGQFEPGDAEIVF